MMRINPDSRISQMLAAIPSELVAEQWKFRITDIISEFPNLKHGIIELRENPYTDQVDLMLCILRNELATKFFDEEKSFDSKNFDHKYPDVSSFLEYWHDEKKFLNSLLSNIYVVFDINNPLEEDIKPWIYLAFKKLAFPPDIYLTLFLNSAEFLPYKFPPQSIPILLKTMEKAKDEIFVFGFGLLNQRGEDKLRIGIQDFKKITSISTYLIECGWEGETDSMIRKVSFLDEFCVDFVLSLKISNHIEAEIGIECNLSKMGNFESARKILSYMAKHFEYNPNRANAILNWLNPESYDSNLAFRWLNHIKFVYENGSIKAFKPYLYFEFFE